MTATYLTVQYGVFLVRRSGQFVESEKIREKQKKNKKKWECLLKIDLDF